MGIVLPTKSSSYTLNIHIHHPVEPLQNPSQILRIICLEFTSVGHWLCARCVCSQTADSLESWRSASSGGARGRCVGWSSFASRKRWTTQTTARSWAWSRRVSFMPRYTERPAWCAGLLSTEASVMMRRRSGRWFVILIMMNNVTSAPKQILLLWILQLRFIDTVVERQPKLRRQRCIFTKERGKDKLFVVSVFVFLAHLSCQFLTYSLTWLPVWFSSSSGKNFLRAAQMNMNFATWGHLMMSILPRYSSFTTFSSSLSTPPDLVADTIPRPTVKQPQTPSPLPRSEIIHT